MYISRVNIKHGSAYPVPEIHRFSANLFIYVVTWHLVIQQDVRLMLGRQQDVHLHTGRHQVTGTKDIQHWIWCERKNMMQYQLKHTIKLTKLAHL